VLLIKEIEVALKIEKGLKASLCCHRDFYRKCCDVSSLCFPPYVQDLIYWSHMIQGWV